MLNILCFPLSLQFIVCARLGIVTDWVHRPVAIRICLKCEFCCIQTLSYLETI